MALLAVSKTTAAQLTSLSLSTIDSAITAGTLPARHHGNRIVILMRDLEKWVETFPEGRPDAPIQLEGKRTGRPPRDKVRPQEPEPEIFHIKAKARSRVSAKEMA